MYFRPPKFFFVILGFCARNRHIPKKNYPPKKGKFAFFSKKQFFSLPIERQQRIFCSTNILFSFQPNHVQSHQKYFPTFDKKENLTNNFFVVADTKDPKGFVRLGNERVIEARLSDAEFFWLKDKSQNLVKKVSKLKSMNYFKGLGTYFDKVQRMRKLGGMLSDELLISKDKVELSASICKVDLVSELVGEFPELQGIMGGYFAEAQGFEKDICKAISEQYLPAGINSKVPKKPYPSPIMQMYPG